MSIRRMGQSRLNNRMGIISLSSESTSMLNLPAELWHLVCAYIHRSSVSTLRLVCHKLSTVAAPYLFRELYINWLPQSISDIAAVAAHPILRHHVRCLVFELSLLDPRLRDFEYWESSCDLEDTIKRMRESVYTDGDDSTLRYLDKIGPRDLPLSETDKKDLHVPVVKLLNDQKRLLNNPQTQESLANILSSLTALKFLKTTKSAKYIDRSDLSTYEDIPTLLDEETDDVERWETIAHCQRVDALLCKPFMATRLTSPDLASLSSILIARAIDLAAPKLKSFNITAWPVDVEDIAMVWPPGKCLPSATRASVRSMTLHLLKHSSRSPTASELSPIGSFIQKAVFLTHIQLELPSYKWTSDDSSRSANNPFNRYFCPNVSCDISGMMDEIRLPYLKSLQLHRFCISEESFVSFMKHHAHTLRRAVFYLPHMRSSGDYDAMPFSSWRCAITEIAPLVSLSYVDLGLFEDAWLSSKLRHVEFLAAQGLQRRFWVTRHATYVEYCRHVSAFLQCQGRTEYPKFETYMEQILKRKRAKAMMEMSMPFMTRAILTSCLAVVISLAGYFFAKLYQARMLFIRRRRMGLPCAPNHNFLFGHLLHLKGRLDALPQNAHYQYMFADIANEHFQSEGLFYIDLWPGSGMTIIVTSPTVAAQVTQTNPEISYHRPTMLTRFFNPIAGGPNLFDMAEKAWRPWRAIFNKGFSSEQLTNIVPHVIHETEVYKDRLRDLAKSETFFYLDLVTLRFTMDIIGQTILNAPLGAQKGYNVLADSMMSQIRWHQANAEANPLGHLNFVRRLVEWWNGRRMNQYIGVELDKRFSEYNSDPSNKRLKSVMDLVLQAYIAQSGSGDQKPKVLDPVFRDFAIRQIRLFLFTGHDSTSSTICYAFHLLSQNPDTLSRIRSEHDKVLGKDCSKASAGLEGNPKLLHELSYTTAVIKEVLRLYPPAASSRQGKPGAFINDDHGRACPTDDVVMIFNIHVELHRNPKYWKRPQQFLPERWLVEPTHELYPVKDAWRAFEYGPRNCIAQGIVMTELKIILACVVREFDFRPAYDEWDRLHPAKGAKVYRGDRAYQMEEAAAHPVEHYPCRVSLHQS